MISERIRGYILAVELTADEKTELDDWLLECDEFDFEEYLELMRQKTMEEETVEEDGFETDDYAY